MLKRILLIAFLASVVTFVGISFETQAQAPTNRMFFTMPSDTGETFMIVDSQYTDAGWEQMCSLIVGNDDTTEYVFTVQGVALMGQRERLFIAFADSLNRHLDTVILKTPLYGAGGVASVAFTATFIKTQLDTITDTFYVYMATGDNNKPIELEDVVFTVLVAARDSLNH